MWPFDLPLVNGGVFILGFFRCCFLDSLFAFGFLAFWLLGFLAFRLLGFLASWLFGFLASWLFGFLAFWLLGFWAFRFFVGLCGFWWLFFAFASSAFPVPLWAFWLLHPFIGFWIWLPASSASPVPLYLNHHFFEHHGGEAPQPTRYCLDCLQSNCTPI